MRPALAKGKTSFSHPLLIDQLQLPGYSGSLGLTFCPGKKGRSLLDHQFWDRQLDVDIERIQVWGASVLVSLMQTHEFSALQVPDLRRKVQAAGIESIHLPIVDGGIPDAGFERQWAIAGPYLHQRLFSGERVVLHCRGGLGRTGLVAAKLLIETGIAPQVAIRQVRAARANTIENTLQENYLLGLNPVTGGRR
jgi:ADP-ribosyl-[dinitrogen reductase] hydrolase